MGTIESVRTQIEQALGQLTEAQLEWVWEVVQKLQQKHDLNLYHLHEYAISTGVPDLAQNHDLYLYDRRDE